MGPMPLPVGRSSGRSIYPYYPSWGTEPSPGNSVIHEDWWRTMNAKSKRRGDTPMGRRSGK